MKGLAVAVLLATRLGFANLILPVPSLTLAWDPSPAPNIAGYRLYQGVASLSYTNVTDLGKVVTASVEGLVPGVTYYFAVTVYNTAGLESKLSDEVSYTVPDGSQVPPEPSLQIDIVAGAQVLLTGKVLRGRVYSLMASEDLVSWAPIWTVLADASESFQFVDNEPAARPQKFYRLQELPTK